MEEGGGGGVRFIEMDVPKYAREAIDRCDMAGLLAHSGGVYTVGLILHAMVALGLQ